MRVLQVHNFYQQAGGEDQVFEFEAQLLRSRGHEVIRYTRHNESIEGMNRLKLAACTVYNHKTFSEVQQLIQREQPDVMHCTNIFPLISPAAYDAAHAEGIPVVQSLHNYRLICPGANLIRGQTACEKCIGSRTFVASVVHGCYQENRLATAVTATMLATHWARGTWINKVNRYIALSEFSRTKFIAGGLPAEKIAVKPNFLPNAPSKGAGDGASVIYVGRLSAEKGIDTLLTAWRDIPETIPLHIVGDGPMAECVREAAASLPHVVWLGQRPHDEVLDRIGSARLLVFPSTCYETFGLTLMEAYAKGTPVVASNHGAAAELVTEGTGAVFQPNEPADLARQVKRLWKNPGLPGMRKTTRTRFLKEFSAETNYQQLLTIYGDALSAVPAHAVSPFDAPMPS